jgi:hypothetical protein
VVCKELLHSRDKLRLNHLVRPIESTVNLSICNVLIRCLKEINVADPVDNVVGASEGYDDLILERVVRNVPKDSIVVIEDSRDFCHSLDGRACSSTLPVVNVSLLTERGQGVVDSLLAQSLIIGCRLAEAKYSECRENSQLE